MKRVFLTFVVGFLSIVLVNCQQQQSEELNHALGKGLEETQESIGKFRQEIQEQIQTEKLTCENYKNHCLAQELIELVPMCQRLYDTVLCQKRFDDVMLKELLSEIRAMLKKTLMDNVSQNPNTAQG